MRYLISAVAFLAALSYHAAYATSGMVVSLPVSEIGENATHVRAQQGPVTLLYHNNLNYSEDASHISFLLLSSRMSRREASAACATYSETLVTKKDAGLHASDLTALLKYEVYRGSLATDESLWLRGGIYSVEHSTQHSFSKEYASATSRRLKALCTQSDTRTVSANSTSTRYNRVNVISSATKNTFQGYRNKKSFRFLGIPYSNNPKRWHYPHLNAQRNTTFNASVFGPQCVQVGNATMSENCLFLNVFTPFLPAQKAWGQHNSDEKGALRSVLVWIHGGAFTGGTGSDPTVDGANIVSRGDIVLVTINYRLSTLGFLAIPGTDIRGNYGIADQITALEWVQQNIKGVYGQVLAK